VAWHPDGRRLATSSWDGTIKVWDALNDMEALALGPASGVRTMAWSADGKRLLLDTLSYDTANGQLVGGLAEGPVWWSATSPDDKWLALARPGRPGWPPTVAKSSIQVKEVRTGRQVAELPTHPSASGKAAWSPDGTRLAYGDCQYGPEPENPRAFRRTWDGIQVWDATTWHKLLTLDCRLPNGVATPQRLAWSPDGGRLAVISTAALWVYGAARGEEVFTRLVEGSRRDLQSLAWSPDGRLIAVGEALGTIGILEADTGAELANFRAHTPAVMALAWSPDGQRLASAASAGDGEIKVWDTTSWNVVWSRRRLATGLSFLAWSPDGKHLLSPGAGRAARIWDAARRPAAWGDSAALDNDWAWALATCADLRWRDPARAVHLAQKATARAPQEGNFWNTLGAARYRAREWKPAAAALEKSMELRQGGDAFDWLFLAMARWQLSDKDQARQWYDKTVQWMNQYKVQDEELNRFRSEAAALLKIEENSNSKPQ
jgi:WD40 repeat protein